MAGLLAAQEHLCIWFLARAISSLEEYVGDPGERWKLLKELVYEALGVSEPGVFLHGAHLTSMGIVVRNRVHELVRKRMAETLKRVRREESEAQATDGMARLEG